MMTSLSSAVAHISLSRLAGAALGLTCMLAPTPASATAAFPAAIIEHWSLERLPVSGDGCRLCHDSDTGQFVTEPFGFTVRNNGAEKNRSSSLRSALDRIRQREVHSDRDGVPDYEEMVGGTNPNVEDAIASGGAGGDGGELPTLPKFPELPRLPVHGCSIGGVAAASEEASLGSLAFGLVFAMALGRRRRLSAHG